MLQTRLRFAAIRRRLRRARRRGRHRPHHEGCKPRRRIAVSLDRTAIRHIKSIADGRFEGSGQGAYPMQDRFIASCASWNEFWERTNKLSTDGQKGAAFERLTQLYLQTSPEYRSELRHVWTLREVPPRVCKRLDLPSRDEGIDLIACTRHGEYWAIQSKFRTQRDKPLNRKELGTFSSLTFNTCSNIALAVVAHTCSKPVSKRHLMRNTTEIGLDRWQSLDEEAWHLIVAKLKGLSARPEVRHPRPHQRAAISAAKKHFISDGATRGRLIMPCGTGKSLTAYWR